MVFNCIDQDVRSFAGEGLLAPIYKPPLHSEFFFPSTSHFTTSSSEFASYPSSTSSEIFHFDPSPTSNHSLSANFGGQSFYDKLHSTSINMLGNFHLGNVTLEQLQDFQRWENEIMQNLDNLGIDPGTTFERLPLDPALEQAAQMQAMNNAAAALQAQQNIQTAPVDQDPIAQGIQNNGDIAFPTFEPVHLDANQLANIVSAGLAKVEEASDFDHNTEMAPEHDVDAEGEPVDYQNLIGFPNPVPMASEDVAALVRLSALPTDQLSQVITELQTSLQAREINNMMHGEEMDIDQPEQVDGIPTFADAPLSATNNIQNVQVQAQPTQTANRSRPDISSFPLPDTTRESRDQYLIDRRADGFTYREIKDAGGYKEAEATLRGRWRTLTKDPEQRLRRPVWEQNDLSLLRSVTYRWFKDNNKRIGDARPPWKILAQEMFDEGASYHFGSGTISKMWEIVHARDRVNLANSNSNA